MLLTGSTRSVLSPSLAVRELGTREFKNVPAPVHVYALEFGGAASVGALPIDPVCHMAVEPNDAAATRTFDGGAYYLCSDECAAAFDADPARYVKP